MKKLIFGIITAFMVLTFIPSQTKAHEDTSIITMTEAKTIESAKATVLLNRLNEINSLDVSNLNGPEKRELREEVRSIKSELNTIGDGIYISAGAIIIILLLIIILL